MKFKITLNSISGNILPINYQYPLSAALYRIIEKGDAEYSQFLHEKGYGKGYKFFAFSDIRCPFKIQGDRLRLLKNELEFTVSFHLPEASQKFIQGLFLSQEIVIADHKSKATFSVKAVEAFPNPLKEVSEAQVVSAVLKPLSIVVAGVKNEKGNYDYLAPDHPRFIESLKFNWRKKIEANYDKNTAENAQLSLRVKNYKNPPRSRLITIKQGKPEETKIRGFYNFLLQAEAEKRFLEVLANCGAGLENAMGFGCVEIVKVKSKDAEIALAVKFKADGDLLDKFIDELVSHQMEFMGGSSRRLIVSGENEEEEIPPVITELLLYFSEGKDISEDMVGYIRNKNRSNITNEQKTKVEKWFTRNVAEHQIGDLVDVWGEGNQKRKV